ncbi:MAG: N-acyl-D-amino-acid deacylase family protein [Dehalococcoidia bacterium]
MLDLLIRGGKVYDGSGNDWFWASVGVEGESLKLLRGDTSQVEARRVIDATGKIVCPGFIDMHAHSGMVILCEPRHEPKVRQGITTELIGVDGNSYAPILKQEDLEQFIELNAGLDGRPPAGSAWRSVGEYLEAFDDKVAVNVCYIMGNSPVRISAMGWDDRPPSGAELQRMRGLIRQGIEEGAWGISTGLTYPPGSYATTEELVELSKTANELGGIYVTHVRFGLGDRHVDPITEALDIGARSGIPVHISHFNSGWPFPGAFCKLLALVDERRAMGQQITADVYPYVYSSTRLVSLIPEWAHDGGVPKLLERMGDEATRVRMAAEPEFQRRNFDQYLVANFKLGRYKRFEGKSLQYISDMLGKSMIDTLCDLLLDENLDLVQIGTGGNPVNVRRFLEHPASMLGSDALLIGEAVSPRTYGAAPTMLGDLVREEGVLTMADCIRKLTSLPAQTIGLTDRGLLRNGFKADIVVFDPETVRSPATIDDPKQFPIGIDYVIVNGAIVVDRGEHTGALPGRALRR